MHQLGRYEILEELGRGAMGTVYRARDPKIGRVVAVKTITLRGVSASEEEEYRQRFFREAQAAGKLSHPGIVTIHDVGEESTTQTPYIVMEYIEGRTLEGLVGASEKRPGVETTVGLVKQIAEALDYAHAQGIVHRDIKAANILVTPEGRAKITDFGIAKLARTQLTLPGEMLGTPAYMSPEQLSGSGVDGRSDLFSLGVILYSMLTGEKPFTGDTTTAVTFKIAYQDPVPATQLNPSLPADFDYVLDRALAKNPARRYQRGRELADDLEDLRRGRPPRSRSGARAEAESPAERTIVGQPLESLPRAAPATRLPLRWGPIAEFGVRVFRSAPAAIRRAPLVEFGQRLPREAQVAIAIIVIFLALFAFRSAGPAATARLNITCEFNFRAAELSVWVDDDLLYVGNLTGAVKRRMGLFETVQGSFSDAVDLPPGKHLVRVRVSSPEEGYDQTRQIEGEFAQNEERTLAISFGRRSRALYLTLH
ncbi:MAG: serine/threonine-protein kinase [Terriglobia bacterium]